MSFFRSCVVFCWITIIHICPTTIDSNNCWTLSSPWFPMLPVGSDSDGISSDFFSGDLLEGLPPPPFFLGIIG
jgi:hypothetical protein